VGLRLLAVLLSVFTLGAQVGEKIRGVETYTGGERLKAHKTPGVSIAVVEGGKIEWARGYGAASASDGRPVGTGTLFQAASISKPVAAMVALRLVEMGKLSLDEDVNLKLRSWKVPENEFTVKEKVTLRRLLSHMAGLTVHGFPGYAVGAAVPTLRQVLEGTKPANTPPIRPDIVPGSVQRYSGGGYEVMQQLVEDVAGKPFPEIARTLVLHPLGMSRSTYQQPLPARLAPAAATAHDGNGAAIAGKWHTYPEMAAAGLWTTPSDLARVILEIQKPGKVLKAATVNEMLTPALKNYGLGFVVGEKEGARTFSHDGANRGFRCMLFAYRDSGRGAVVMTNGEGGRELASEVLRSIAREYGWPE
jgi:CubicO group peptidase (beta-lactamase class C family)